MADPATARSSYTTDVLVYLYEMTDQDLRVIYWFIRGLGPAGE